MFEWDSHDPTSDLGNDFDGADPQGWPEDQGTPDMEGADAARAARKAVQDWHIAAVGGRPIDHLARDLLFGSLFRDKRPRGFHQRVRNPPDWVKAQVAHLPQKDQEAAIRLTVLHYLHLRSLAKMHAEHVALYGDADDGYPGVLKQLSRCWPYGALVEWEGKDYRSPRDVCRLAWLCPWCFARRVVDVYSRLAAHLQQKPDNRRHLLLLDFLIVEDMFLRDPDIRNLLAAGGPRRRPASWQNSDPLSYEKLSAELDCVHGPVKELFAKGLKECGITGGLWVTQVGPWLMDESWQTRAFRHDVALLAEVSIASAAQRRRLEEFAGLGKQKQRFLGDRLGSSIGTFLLPAQDPRALRFLLAGSAPSYSWENLPLETNTAEGPSLLQAGVPGAFKLQPVFMFDEAEHSTYAEATRGMALYSPFGTWRKALGRPRDQPPKPTLPRPAPKGKRRRLRALARVNESKQEQAQGRRAQLLLSALAALDRLEVSGLDLGRVQLEETLQGVGIRASERDLRWLSAELRRSKADEFFDF